MKKTELKIETTNHRSFMLLCISLSLAFILILSGCASNKDALLQTVMPVFPPYSETIDDVTLSCKTLSKEECKQIFDQNIIQKGYQPVLISIKNDTKRHMFFSSQEVSLPVCSPQEVTTKLNTYGADWSPVPTGLSNGIGNAGPGILILLPFAIVGALAENAAEGVSQMNAETDRTFNELNSDNLLIKPNAEHSGIIFISKGDFKDSFFVNLVDKESNEKIKYHVKGLKGYY
jgi:hypothetical protein